MAEKGHGKAGKGGGGNWGYHNGGNHSGLKTSDTGIRRIPIGLSSASALSTLALSSSMFNDSFSAANLFTTFCARISFVSTSCCCFDRRSAGPNTERSGRSGAATALASAPAAAAAGATNGARAP